MAILAYLIHQAIRLQKNSTKIDISFSTPPIENINGISVPYGEYNRAHCNVSNDLLHAKKNPPKK